MKNIIIFTFIIILSFSCNDEYLEKIPKDQVTNENFWNTDGDFQTFSLGLYNFYGFGVGNARPISLDNDEVVAGNQVQSSLIFDRRTVPNTGGAWSWSYLRSCNIMIREARNADLDAESKLHWEGVGRLLRAREYFSKVVNFGDVPWIDQELGTESPELFMKQDSRSTVMNKVLEDLQFAVENIRTDAGVNLINRDVALAIKSEICLFEGSFRKYHTELGLSDSDMWLRESVIASEAILNSNKYALADDFRSIYSSVDLAGNPEVIFYKQYELGVIVNVQARLLGVRDYYGATKNAVESFLCSDGLPYGVSDLQPNAKAGLPVLINDEFKNRDPRMKATLLVPFDENNPPQNDPLVMDVGALTTPSYSPALIGESGISNPTGYPLYKWWSLDTPVDDVNGTLDAPLYTYKMILLNYAEAKAELGECDNAVLDKSINLLRNRVGMPAFTMEWVNSFEDPKRLEYAPEISNLLWEIRRERRVETMLEGSRYDDILRWKKASYFGKPILGAYIDLDQRPAIEYNEDGSNKTNVILGDKDGNPLPEGSRIGYVLPYIERQPNWSDDDLKMYYYPINSEALTINPNLEQSPGW
ncbi:RagB/SusD family nutrient uptake outer membrane protein [Membranihabitans marinus]|uniref:RagB/SusD family nutrient uptake outer membrane protein n=1 Tax=Membranihabitans marinus TaxID=1227546 RepID=UPI001F15BC24|nr:RagB/SusD family nutrient uptake outer membrane protein [Membranihabitans marinus]